MGIWGPGLYESDLAEEIKVYFNDQLRRGKRGEQITTELLDKYKDVLQDYDEMSVFWLALADMQWDFGRLEDYVKNEAIKCLNNEYGTIDCSNYPWDIKKRKEVLFSLNEKLNTPQPPPKRITKYKYYHCDWNIGDVFAYQFSCDFGNFKISNKFCYFVKVDEELWHPGHTIPVVYCFRVISDLILPVELVREKEVVPQFFSPEAYNNYPELKKLYALALLSTSSKKIPYNRLTFIGNIGEIPRIDNENMNSYKVAWKDLENYLIKNFVIWEVLKSN